MFEEIDTDKTAARCSVESDQAGIPPRQHARSTRAGPHSVAPAAPSPEAPRPGRSDAERSLYLVYKVTVSFGSPQSTVTNPLPERIRAAPVWLS